MTKKKAQKKTKPEVITVTTKACFLKISPRKLRLVVEAVKELSPAQAVLRLGIWNKKGARLMLKALKTVIADAENNFGLDKESLRFKKILVNEGPRLKRIDRFHGARFASGLRQRRMAHLEISVVGTKEK